MSDIKIYHREIGFPKGAVADFVGHVLNLAYTRHALREAVSHAPRSVPVYADNIIEIEQEDGVTTKLVVRVPYDERRDLVLVLRGMDDGSARVCTLWTNSRTDTHATLDKTKYSTP